MKKRTQRLIIGFGKFYILGLGLVAITGIGYGFLQVIMKLV